MDDNAAFVAVARRIFPGGQLLRCWPLKGGTSASMHALEVCQADGQIQRVVVRRHGANDWKRLADGVTATEFGLLQALRRERFAVPEPHLLDASGELLPSPYFAMEFVEGTTTVDDAALPNALRRMAAYLARLHALDIEATQLPPLPEREDPREGCLEYLPSNELGIRVRAALQEEGAGSRHEQRAPARPPSLLHGDFWPENVLWKGDEIAAVVDWEDTAIGDPASDLACCRVELLCHYDEAAMDAFTEHYAALASVDQESLSLWELYASSAAVAMMAKWGLEPHVEARRRRRTTRFMEQAGRAVLAQWS